MDIKSTRIDHENGPERYWSLHVIYSCSLDGPMDTWFPLDEPLAELLGDSDGSGTGFGERDHDFDFVTKAAAVRAKAAVARLAKSTGVKIVTDVVEVLPEPA